MYAKKVVYSSVFHMMMFPHDGKVITIDHLTYYEPHPSNHHTRDIWLNQPGFHHMGKYTSTQHGIMDWMSTEQALELDAAITFCETRKDRARESK